MLWQEKMKRPTKQQKHDEALQTGPLFFGASHEGATHVGLTHEGWRAHLPLPS